MSAAQAHRPAEDEHGAGEPEDGRHPRLGIAPDVVEVRRRGGVAAGVGLTASTLAIAYLARASDTGAGLDWAMAASLAVLAAYWLAGLVDARTPLLVADSQGIRLRLGRTWRGLPWTAVHHVEHLPRRGLLRDGRIIVVPHNPELVESGLDGTGRLQAALTRALYGSPFAVPLGLATRSVGAGPDLSRALERIADSSHQVIVVDDAVSSDPEAPPSRGGPRTHSLPDPRPRLARLLSRVADAHPYGRHDSDVSQPAHEAGPDRAADAAPAASARPSPLRESTPGRRSEVHHQLPVEDEPSHGRELRRPGSINLVEETQAWGDRVRPIARAGESVEPLVLGEFAVEPAEDPVIGPEVAAARTRLGLTVDQLAQRTRIRPHVIESIEVDDFAPCGGDFYARGHLRTLARILGVDAAPLLASYDERYAHAPVNPRRVFEAELATGAHGSIRGTRGGPNWSVLVAVVMSLVLCWSVARLVMDSPPELRTGAPVLNGSGGPQGAATAPLAKPVPVVLDAVSGGAHVVVRDGAGEIVFKGDLAAGGSRELDASPPVRVQSSDGAVTVAIAGGPARPVGDQGVAGQGTFVAP